jgi:hypothetical protein
MDRRVGGTHSWSVTEATAQDPKVWGHATPGRVGGLLLVLRGGTSCLYGHIYFERNMGTRSVGTFLG